MAEAHLGGGRDVIMPTISCVRLPRMPLNLEPRD
jgi:hypothetical protein